MSTWKTSEEKIHDLCERVVATTDEEAATKVLVELKAALSERIRQIKDCASEVVPLISDERKIKKAG